MNQNTLASIIIASSIIIGAFVYTSNSAASSGPQVREFNVVMENNQYTPNYLAANLGDTVIINFENLDDVSHAVEIPEFGGTVPGGHVVAGEKAQMKFLANKRTSTDIATCGGPDPTDKTDDHGEELIVEIL